MHQSSVIGARPDPHHAQHARACDVLDRGGRASSPERKAAAATTCAGCERSFAMLKGLLWVVVIIFVIGLLVVLGVLDFIF